MLRQYCLLLLPDSIGPKHALFRYAHLAMWAEEHGLCTSGPWVQVPAVTFPSCRPGDTDKNYIISALGVFTDR